MYGHGGPQHTDNGRCEEPSNRFHEVQTLAATGYSSAQSLCLYAMQWARRLKDIADRGYYSSVELKDCEDAAIASLVFKSMASDAKAEGYSAS